MIQTQSEQLIDVLVGCGVGVGLRDRREVLEPFQAVLVEAPLILRRRLDEAVERLACDVALPAGFGDVAEGLGVRAQRGVAERVCRWGSGSWFLPDQV